MNFVNIVLNKFICWTFLTVKLMLVVSPKNNFNRFTPKKLISCQSVSK